MPSETTEALFARYGPAYRWLATVTVMLGAIAAMLTTTSVNVAIPDMCWSVLSALRSADSIARASPCKRISTVPAGTASPSRTSVSMPTFGSSVWKKLSASCRPATTIGYRDSLNECYHAYLSRNEAEFQWADGAEEPLRIDDSQDPGEEEA